jgi:hypothetical protein
LVLGRVQRAQAEGKQFLARYPGTAHRGHIEALLRRARQRSEAPRP